MTSDTDFQLDEMKEIIEDFLVEADELVSSLDTNLVTLESSSDDLDLLNEIFRAAHTIKGTSSFLGFDQVTTLTHRMEDILNKLRKSELTVTAEIMDLLLESVDLLKVLLENVRTGNDETLDLDDILRRLEAALSGGPAKASNEDQPDLTGPPQQTSGQSVTATETTSGSADKGAATASIKGEKPGAKGNQRQTLRVDVKKLDTLMNMMGELVLGRNSLQQTVNQINKEREGDHTLEPLNQASTAINFITTELQMAVMKMRMQPVSKVFKRFPRLVRDLARTANKQIDLEISGETTELDKSVIEEIGDPLVHLIRNSCDHGIESPEERTAAGKPATGVVRLNAGQEGSSIVITITDDGKGLDIDAIRSKAVERGMASREEIDQMPEREVFKFIFEAGFSTASKVTGVSGRGVGMDVVRTNIQKLNGLVELDSKKGVGTSFTIKLPLTLAIVQGLLVEDGSEVFILPLSSVYETVRSDQSDIYYVNQRPVLRLRDEIIPVVQMAEVLNRSSAGFSMSSKPYIVIVGLAEKKLGVQVDRFLGQEEVVIKSLGQYLGATEGISGATILGDGRIRLIVDLIGLFNVANKLS